MVGNSKGIDHLLATGPLAHWYEYDQSPRSRCFFVPGGPLLCEFSFSPTTSRRK